MCACCVRSRAPPFGCVRLSLERRECARLSLERRECVLLCVCLMACVSLMLVLLMSCYTLWCAPHFALLLCTGAVWHNEKAGPCPCASGGHHPHTPSSSCDVRALGAAGFQTPGPLRLWQLCTGGCCRAGSTGQSSQPTGASGALDWAAVCSCVRPAACAWQSVRD